MECLTSRALTVLSDCLGVHDSCGDRAGGAITLFNHALVLYDLDEPELVMEQARTALQDLRAFRSPHAQTVQAPPSGLLVSAFLPGARRRHRGRARGMRLRVRGTWRAQGYLFERRSQRRKPRRCRACRLPAPGPAEQRARRPGRHTSHDLPVRPGSQMKGSSLPMLPPTGPPASPTKHDG